MPHNLYTILLKIRKSNNIPFTPLCLLKSCYDEKLMEENRLSHKKTSKFQSSSEGHKAKKRILNPIYLNSSILLTYPIRTSKIPSGSTNASQVYRDE
jgi:hypothetical protein